MDWTTLVPLRQVCIHLLHLVEKALHFPLLLLQSLYPQVGLPRLVDIQNFDVTYFRIISLSNPAVVHVGEGIAVVSSVFIEV